MYVAKNGIGLRVKRSTRLARVSICHEGGGQFQDDGERIREKSECLWGMCFAQMREQELLMALLLKPHRGRRDRERQYRNSDHPPVPVQCGACAATIGVAFA